MVKYLIPLFLLLAVCLQVSAQGIDMKEVEALEAFRWGLRAFHSGSFEDSILSLEKSLSIKPQDSRTRFWLGSALYRSGFEEAALNEWRYLLEQDPGNDVVENAVQVLDYRRGLGQQMEGRTALVVASVVDAADSSYYPLRRPTSVSVRRDGSVYVVAFASNEIALLDVNNQVRSVLRGGLRGLDRPYDCLEIEDPVSGESCLFIAEYGRNRVLKTKLNGEPIEEIGAAGNGPGELLGPQYLASDGKGYLYVSDWGNGRVNKYAYDGSYILSMGRRAESEERLTGPTGIAFQDDRLYVADRNSKRIVVYDESGNYLGSMGRGVLSGPEGLSFRDRDTLLVADTNRILAYSLRRETWTTLNDMHATAGHLTHLDVSPNNEVYVVDFDKNKIYILSEMSSLYTSLFVQVDRIDSFGFPEIVVEITAEDRSGAPVVGLGSENFIVSERYRQVRDLELVRSPSEPAPLEVTLVVEKSTEMEQFKSNLSAAVQSLHVQLAGDASPEPGSLRVLSAGESASVEAELGASRLEAVQAALRGRPSYDWRFDRGVRLAASQAIPSHSRKAVVFLGTGRLNDGAFSEYSLAEVSDYLQNNSIALYVVHFGTLPDRELEYLCSQTGGNCVSYFSPGGAGTLISEIQKRIGSQYLLTYTSRSDSDFGKSYIDLQAEVILHRKSGRTESGYFAPLSE